MVLSGTQDCGNTRLREYKIAGAADKAPSILYSTLFAWDAPILVLTRTAARGKSYFSGREN